MTRTERRRKKSPSAPFEAEGPPAIPPPPYGECGTTTFDGATGVAFVDADAESVLGAGEGAGVTGAELSTVACAAASFWAASAVRASFSMRVVSLKICCTSGVIFTRGSNLIVIGCVSVWPAGASDVASCRALALEALFPEVSVVASRTCLNVTIYLPANLVSCVSGALIRSISMFVYCRSRVETCSKANDA